MKVPQLLGNMQDEKCLSEYLEKKYPAKVEVFRYGTKSSVVDTYNTEYVNQSVSD